MKSTKKGKNGKIERSIILIFFLFFSYREPCGKEIYSHNPLCTRFNTIILFPYFTKKKRKRRKNTKEEIKWEKYRKYLISISNMLTEKEYFQLTISGCHRWCRCKLQNVNIRVHVEKKNTDYISFLHSYFDFVCTLVYECYCILQSKLRTMYKYISTCLVQFLFNSVERITKEISCFICCLFSGLFHHLAKWI